MNRTTRMTALAAGAMTALLLAGTAGGEIESKRVEYNDGETVLEGYMVAGGEGKRPGVLVFHEWWGLNDYAEMRARQLAELGYVAFAADMYGKGRRAKTPAAAGKLAGAVKGDRELMRRRARLALKVLRSDRRVQGRPIAAIGFCFGGTCALELARSGADVRAVASFHGGLSTPKPAKAGTLRASILVLHGAADPHVPQEEVNAFKAEMAQAGADWQMVVYGDAVHAFTNPSAGTDASSGAAYNRKAAQRSWAAMKVFFAETIGLPSWSGDSGVGEFIEDKIVDPSVKAGKATGKAVQTGAKATGKAVKKGATWLWDRLKGEEDDKR